MKKVIKNKPKEKINYLKMSEISINDKYEISEEQLRELFANRDNNELKNNYVQFGKRVFVDECAFNREYDKIKKRIA